MKIIFIAPLALFAAVTIMGRPVKDSVSVPNLNTTIQKVDSIGQTPSILTGHLAKMDSIRKLLKNNQADSKKYKELNDEYREHLKAAIAETTPTSNEDGIINNTNK